MWVLVWLPENSASKNRVAKRAALKHRPAKKTSYWTNQKKQLNGLARKQIKWLAKKIISLAKNMI